MSVHELASLTTKSRTDSYSDQYNHILVVKILMACSVITGINWYKDSMNCINDSNVADQFVTSTCWIQGVYIYKELKYRVDDVAYYGIPKDINMDGVMENGNLCQKNTTEHCTIFTKTLFFQYQWFPFYIALLTFIYFSPYILHQYWDDDIINLKKSVKAGDTTPERVVWTHFNPITNPIEYHLMQTLSSYLIKVIYIAVNLGALYVTNNILYKKFASYGISWLQWFLLEKEKRYDYMGINDRPGHKVLPPFGFCQLYFVTHNQLRQHRFLCELTQNILTQDILLALWFLIIIGIAVSIIGFIILGCHHIVLYFSVLGHFQSRINRRLSLRECEYLDFIRRYDIHFYEEIISLLRSRPVVRLPQYQ